MRAGSKSWLASCRAGAVSCEIAALCTPNSNTRNRIFSTIRVRNAACVDRRQERSVGERSTSEERARSREVEKSADMQEAPSCLGMASPHSGSEPLSRHQWSQCSCGVRHSGCACGRCHRRVQVKIQTCHNPNTGMSQVVIDFSSSGYSVLLQTLALVPDSARHTSVWHSGIELADSMFFESWIPSQGQGLAQAAWVQDQTTRRATEIMMMHDSEVGAD
eukprot:3941687-Rhodomonas_salina.5